MAKKKRSHRAVASQKAGTTQKNVAQKAPAFQKRVGTCACGEEATNLCQFCKEPLWCSTACLVKDDGSHDPQCASLLAARKTAREAPQAQKKTTVEAKGVLKKTVVDEAKVAYYRKEGVKLARMGRYEAAVVAHTHAIAHLEKREWPLPSFSRSLKIPGAGVKGFLPGSVYGERAAALLALERPKLALMDLEKAIYALCWEDVEAKTEEEEETIWKVHLTAMQTACGLGLYDHARCLARTLTQRSHRDWHQALPIEKRKTYPEVFTAMVQEIQQKLLSSKLTPESDPIGSITGGGEAASWPCIEGRERFGCTRPSVFLPEEKTADVRIHLSGAAGLFDVVVAALDWYMQEEPHEMAAQTWQEQLERMAAVAVEKRDGSLTLVVSGPVYEVMGPLLITMGEEMLKEEAMWLDSSLHLCFDGLYSEVLMLLFDKATAGDMEEYSILPDMERPNGVAGVCSYYCLHHVETSTTLADGIGTLWGSRFHTYFLSQAKEVLRTFRAILLHSDVKIGIECVKEAAVYYDPDLYLAYTGKSPSTEGLSLLIQGRILNCITPPLHLRDVPRIVAEIQCCRGPALSEEEFVLFTGLSLEGMRRIYGYDVELRGGKGFFPTVLFIKRDIPKIESMEEVKELLAMVVRAYKVLVVQGPTLLDPSRGDKAVAYVSAADYVKVLVQLLEIPAATEALSKSLVEKAWAVTAELAMGQTEVFEYAISSYALVNEVGVHPVAYKLDVVPPCLLTSADEGGSFPLYDTKAYYAEVIYLVRSACVLTDFECWEEILNDASTEEVFAWLRERPPGDVSKIVGERVPDCDTSIFIRQSDYETCGEDAILLRFDLEENAFLVNRLPPYEDVFV